MISLGENRWKRKAAALSQELVALKIEHEKLQNDYRTYKEMMKTTVAVPAQEYEKMRALAAENKKLVEQLLGKQTI